jgi:two-component system response regulator HydG
MSDIGKRVIKYFGHTYGQLWQRGLWMTDRYGILPPDLSLPISNRGRNLLSVLLDYFDTPTILLSPDYRIIAVNRAYKTTYSLERKAVGRRCYAVSHHLEVPCDLAGEACPLQAAMDSDKRARALHVHYTSRGEEYVNVEIAAIRNDAGEVLFLVEHMHKPRIRLAAIPGEGLVGRSKAFMQLIQRIQRVAPSQTAVLLLGESGTGKELAAQAVHQASGNPDGPFVPVECSGLPETLFESELFGHEKGAFTGAVFRKQGLVEAARGGTLFLDEIGDIQPVHQAKLLRLLETGTYRPVGSVEPKQANFRLVCATHRDLKQMVEDGSFRQDLYFRINVFPIRLPPLRERREDLSLLVATLLKRIAGKRAPKMAPSALQCLKDYAFPGNIRELRNILEYAVLLTDDDIIGPEHLPKDCGCDGRANERAKAAQEEILSLEEIQEDYLRKILAHYHSDRKSLATRLGISERTLYRKIELLRERSGGSETVLKIPHPARPRTNR